MEASLYKIVHSRVWILRILQWFTVVIGVCLVLVNVFRRLNYDESLALRAGWLHFNHIPAEPSFYMPFTLWLGWLATYISEPLILFVTLRLMVLFSILAAFWFLFRKLRLSSLSRLLFVVILMCNLAFVTHGFEFRYDSIILVLLLVAMGLLHETVPNAFITAFLTIMLAAHHLKGGVFAAWLYLIVNWIYLMHCRGCLLRYHLWLISWILGWIILSHFLGFSSLLLDFYASFVSTSIEVDHHWVSRPLLLSLKRDAFWWLLILAVGLLATVRKISKDQWITASLCLAIGVFWLAHPNPWPYMPALAVPFVTLFGVLGLEAIGTPKSLVVGLFVLFAGLTQGLSSSNVMDYLIRARKSNLAGSTPWLSYIKRHALKDDTVFDPSGYIYFLPPSNRQWYIDGLFLQRYRKKSWMQYSSEQWLGADWVLDSYRSRIVFESEVGILDQHYTSIGCATLISDKVHDRSFTKNDLDCDPRSFRNFW